MTDKVVVCLPCHGDIKPRTVGSLMALVEAEQGKLVVDVVLSPYLYVDENRNTCCRMVCDGRGLPNLLGRLEGWQASEAYQGSITHALFLDSDMTWPRCCVSKLLNANRAVVGGNYFQKDAPFACVAFELDEVGGVHRLENLTQGLRVVGGLGMGCTLIGVDILRQMRTHFSDERWFRSEECGEDVHFFRRLRQMRVQPFLDQDLECGHLGVNEVGRFHHDAWQQATKDGGVKLS